MIAIMLMPPIDGSALNVVIPILKRQFSADLTLVAWVPLVYLLINGSLILPVGRLGDLWGFRRLFLIGIVIFTGASLVCGLAPTLGWLIAARVLQAVGASLMMALNVGIITALFPPTERGRALGFAGMGIAVGLVIGPTLGGFLASFHWSWIFYINIPIGIIGGLWCWRVLPPLPPAHHRRVDWAGTVLEVVGLGALLLAITQGEHWGWFTAPTLGFITLFIIAATLFISVELNASEPILPFFLFKNRTFASGIAATLCNFLGQFSALFLTPMLLQEVYFLTPLRTGLVMSVIPVAVIILAPISGRLSDRLGTRGLAVAGETIVAIGLLLLAFLAPLRSAVAIIPALALVGLGTGLFQAPNNSAIMGSVPRTHLGIGGGVLATMRNLGMAFGIAVSSAVYIIASGYYQAEHAVTDGAAMLHGIRIAYLVGAVITALGSLASAIRPASQSKQTK